jgi:hypothetical protein
METTLTRVFRHHWAPKSGLHCFTYTHSPCFGRGGVLRLVAGTDDDGRWLCRCFQVLGSEGTSEPRPLGTAPLINCGITYTTIPLPFRNVAVDQKEWAPSSESHPTRSRHSLCSHVAGGVPTHIKGSKLSAERAEDQNRAALQDRLACLMRLRTYTTNMWVPGSQFTTQYLR